MCVVPSPGFNVGWYDFQVAALKKGWKKERTERAWEYLKARKLNPRKPYNWMEYYVSGH